METVLILIAAFALLSICVFFIVWGGKCKNCGSWRNWVKKVDDYDSHKGRVYDTEQSKCSKCGHTKIVKKNFLKIDWRRQ